MSTYQHIAQRAAQVPVRQLCQVLRVAPAAYYAWQRLQQVRAVEPAWQVAVREAFAHHSQRYGTRRLRAEVQAQGHAVGRWRIRRVLKAHGLRAQPPRSFVPRTTDSNLAVRAAPNRLLGQPAPTAPNRVWVGSRHVPAPPGRGLALPGRLARPLLAQGRGLGRALPRCQKTWSARPCAAPSWCAGPRPDSSCTPTRIASTRPPASRPCSRATARNKA
ncbi:IS3 family transposase [Hymenobacter seoulensis]